MNDAIHVDQIKKTYARGWRKPRHEALKGISLNIAEGETFGFIGPNGAGKSTFIKILIGTLYPDSGQAYLFGLAVSNSKARLQMGFVPENPSLPNYLTPFEILHMALKLHHVNVANEKQHCMAWLERFNLASVANNPIRSFSKGMMQRTVLAQALAIKPRLLILDEPLSGLDPVGRKDVIDILDEYRKSGGTLFFSSHVLYDVERIADRFGLIHKGELLTIRSPKEVIADQADFYILRYRSSTALEGSKTIRTDLFEIEAEAAGLAALITKIQTVGGLIQDILPKNTLETVFFRMIENEKPPTAS